MQVGPNEDKECEVCKKKFDEDEEGINVYNAFTGGELDFCSDKCHIAWAKKQGGEGE